MAFGFVFHLVQLGIATWYRMRQRQIFRPLLRSQEYGEFRSSCDVCVPLTLYVLCGKRTLPVDGKRR